MEAGRDDMTEEQFNALAKWIMGEAGFAANPHPVTKEYMEKARDEARRILVTEPTSPSQ